MRKFFMEAGRARSPRPGRVSCRITASLRPTRAHHHDHRGARHPGHLAMPQAYLTSPEAIRSARKTAAVLVFKKNRACISFGTSSGDFEFLSDLLLRGSFRRLQPGSIRNSSIYSERNPPTEESRIVKRRLPSPVGARSARALLSSWRCGNPGYS